MNRGKIGKKQEKKLSTFWKEKLNTKKQQQQHQEL